MRWKQIQTYVCPEMPHPIEGCASPYGQAGSLRAGEIAQGHFPQSSAGDESRGTRVERESFGDRLGIGYPVSCGCEIGNAGVKHAGVKGTTAEQRDKSSMEFIAVGSADRAII